MPPWVEKVKDSLEQNSSLLRSQTWTGGLKDVDEPSERLRNRVENLEEQVDLQIGTINRLLMDSEVVAVLQLHLDEIGAVREEFAELLPQALPSDLGRGLPGDSKLRNEIVKALLSDMDSFMGQLMIERRSLSDDGLAGELIARLGAKLGEMLGSTDLSDDERLNLFNKFISGLEDRLPGVVDEICGLA